jgi:Na+/H+ antiporter NhaC
MIEVGFWVFVPALVAVFTVFILRDVIASLFIGIVRGAFVYAVSTGDGLWGERK